MMKLKNKIFILILIYIAILLIGTTKVKANNVLVWPVPGFTGRTQDFHNNSAIDIGGAGVNGLNVVAAKEGTVIYVFRCGLNHWDPPIGDGQNTKDENGYINGCTHSCNGFGNGVVIRGKDDRTYEYAHMLAGSIPSYVYEGATIKAGQKIGQVGSTGLSTGPHLHFGITDYYDYWKHSGINPLYETYIENPVPDNVVTNLGSFSARIVAKENQNIAIGVDSLEFKANVCLRNKDINDSSQLWQFIKNDDDTYIIKNAKTGFVFDVINALNDNGTNVWVFGQNNLEAQRWYITSFNGGYRLVPQCSSDFKALDMQDGVYKDGTNIFLYENIGTNCNNQTFLFEKGTKDKVVTNLGSFATRIVAKEDKNYVIGVDSLEFKANVCLKKKNLNDNSKLWYFIKNTDNSYIIKNAKTGFVFDVINALNDNGTNVWAFGQNNLEAQRWFITSFNGGYRLVPQSSWDYKGLDVQGAVYQPGTNIFIYESIDTNHDNQTFLFEKQIVDNVVTNLGDFDARIVAKENKSFVVGVDSLEFKANVCLRNKDLTDNSQLWHFKKNEDNTYIIKNAKTGFVLDVINALNDNATNVWAFGQNNLEAQRWYITSFNKGYRLVPQCSWDYKALDVQGAVYQSGTNLFIYESVDNNHDNQTFLLEKIEKNPKHSHIWNKGTITKLATCKEEGLKTYTCTGCFEAKTEVIAKLAHNYKTITKPATQSADGKSIIECAVGREIKSTTKIPKIQTISLSKTSFTYNQKTQKPIVTIKDSKGKTLKNGTDYTVSYSNKNSKKIGKYIVIVTFKENYEGTKKLTYKINPKGTSLKKLTAGKKHFKASWNKQVTETTGYEIQYSTNKNFKSGNKTSKIKKNKTTSSTIKSLKGKKKYYVRIRTYKTVNGETYYSSWSKSKNITTKK